MQCKKQIRAILKMRKIMPKIDLIIPWIIFNNFGKKLQLVNLIKQLDLILKGANEVNFEFGKKNQHCQRVFRPQCMKYIIDIQAALTLS